MIARFAKRISATFAWYDLWVGVYIDTKKQRVYICPLPTLLITIEVGYGQR